MPSLKFILTIFLLVFTAFACYSQGPTVDCSRDSTEYLTLSQMLDTTEAGNINNLELLHYSILSPAKKRDCFCDLLIYTRIFDFLLEKELDLNYHVLQNPPRRNSTNVPDDSAQINNNNKYYTFRQFLKIKNEYEKSVLKRYENEKNRTLILDVDNILKYNVYAYPSVLKGVLLGKYAHLTREKLQAEVYQFYGEPVGKH